MSKKTKFFYKYNLKKQTHNVIKREKMPSFYRNLRETNFTVKYTLFFIFVVYIDMCAWSDRRKK